MQFTQQGSTGSQGALLDFLVDIMGRQEWFHGRVQLIGHTVHFGFFSAGVVICIVANDKKAGDRRQGAQGFGDDLVPLFLYGLAQLWQQGLLEPLPNMNRIVIVAGQHGMDERQGIQSQSLAGSFAMQFIGSSRCQKGLNMSKDTCDFRLPSYSPGCLAQGAQQGQSVRFRSFPSLFDTQQLFTSLDECRSIGGSQINVCNSTGIHLRVLNDHDAGFGRFDGHRQESGETIQDTDATIFLSFLESADQCHGNNGRLIPTSWVVLSPQSGWIMLLAFHNSLECPNGGTSDLPGLVIIIVVVFFFVILVFIFIVFVIFIVHVVVIVPIMIVLFRLVIVAVRVVGIVTHVRQRRLNDFIQMRLDLSGASQDKGFKSHETRLSQFIGHRHGAFILNEIITHGRHFVVHSILGDGTSAIIDTLLVVNIVIVSRQGLFRVGVFQKDGNDPINLWLLQAMSYRS
mmetsp:Transcript_60385/g.169277  ORF Transcript_60385/g.169277 Transcript_60385/m.169277 type:complete len:457 (+) Transcript_60385:1475-2845(+)